MSDESVSLSVGIEPGRVALQIKGLSMWSCTWIGLTPEHARRLAAELLAMADEVDRPALAVVGPPEPEDAA